MEQSMKEDLSSNITMNSRKSIKLTGVKDIEKFDEKFTVILTNLGKIQITGNSLKMGKFCVETGDLELNGKFDSIVYLDKKNVKGFWKSLFS